MTNDTPIAPATREVVPPILRSKHVHQNTIFVLSSHFVFILLEETNETAKRGAPEARITQPHRKRTDSNGVFTSPATWAPGSAGCCSLGSASRTEPRENVVLVTPFCTTMERAQDAEIAFTLYCLLAYSWFGSGFWARLQVTSGLRVARRSV